VRSLVCTRARANGGEERERERESCVGAASLRRAGANRGGLE